MVHWRDVVTPTRYLDPQFTDGEGQLDFSGDMRDTVAFSEQQFINTARR